MTSVVSLSLKAGAVLRQNSPSSGSSSRCRCPRARRRSAPRCRSPRWRSRSRGRRANGATAAAAAAAAARCSSIFARFCSATLSASRTSSLTGTGWRPFRAATRQSTSPTRRTATRVGCSACRATAPRAAPRLGLFSWENTVPASQPDRHDARHGQRGHRRRQPSGLRRPQAPRGQRVEKRRADERRPLASSTPSTPRSRRRAVPSHLCQDTPAEFDSPTSRLGRQSGAARTPRRRPMACRSTAPRTARWDPRNHPERSTRS